MQKTTILSVANRKGGVGKSTVTMLFAGMLAARRGVPVAVLDCDAQKSISGVAALDAMIYPDAPPLFDVFAMPPGDVPAFLSANGAAYAFVFIDVPRITESKTDDALGQLLALCDCVLVPALGSLMDALSTIDFIRMLGDVRAFKKQYTGVDMNFAAFVNRANARKENQQTADTLKGEGVDVLGVLPDLKAFASPSTRAVVSNARFDAFFIEICEHFNL
jgi:cellulose biosynthesis protein BcsQ